MQRNPEDERREEQHNDGRKHRADEGPTETRRREEGRGLPEASRRNQREPGSLAGRAGSEGASRGARAPEAPRRRQAQARARDEEVRAGELGVERGYGGGVRGGVAFSQDRDAQAPHPRGRDERTRGAQAERIQQPLDYFSRRGCPCAVRPGGAPAIVPSRPRRATSSGHLTTNPAVMP